MRRRLAGLLLGCACGGGTDDGGADASGASSDGSSSDADATAGTTTTTGTTTGGTAGESTGEDGSSGGSTEGGGDGLAPTASMVFPGPLAVLPHGPAYPLVGGGIANGDEAIAEVELAVDDRVVASGAGVPLLWNPDDVDPGSAVSVETIDGDGHVELVATALHTYAVVGLAPVDQAGDPMADPHYRFHLSPAGYLFLRGFQPEGTYAQGDALRIEVAQGTVRYLKNGVELHSEPLVEGDGPLALDVALNARASLAAIVLAADGGAAAPPSWSEVVVLAQATGLAATWDSTALADGPHAFTVRVVDAGGDEATSDAVQKAVDNTDPECTIESPTADEVVSGSVQIVATASDLHLGVDAFFVDDMLVSQQDGLELAMFDWDTQSVGNGPHTIRFDAIDDAGNVASCEIGVTVSN
jgi:hypothetical protein